MKGVLAARNYLIAPRRVYEQLDGKLDRANGVGEMDALDPTGWRRGYE